MLSFILKKKVAAQFLFFILFFSQFFLSCADIKKKETGNNIKKEDSISLVIQNPVLRGDFADPSVVRVGEDYWATATSSEWAPLFPLLHSTNLKDWKIMAHVFPESLPDWTEAHFWAPEIAYDNGKYFIYYTAKKKDGPLCVGVASSENATGPYKDHGAIVCQEAGAIDGFQIRDDEGKLFLIWKEDGNSRGEPTPMWGQEMNEERTELIGERFELFRNDPDTWEGNLVEGAALIKKNGYYYTFYSGDACCGRECTYGIGVARAKKLRGPWEKYEKNPLKKENEDWKCMGHGTMVQDEEGRYFFLYHAYSKEGSVFTGRQGLLDEVVWREDGWPEFRETDAQRVDGENRANPIDIKDDFRADELSKYWQWPVGSKPEVSLKGNSLSLESRPDKLGAVLAQRTLSSNYEAITAVQVNDNSNENGLAAIGDQNNALGIFLSGNKILVWRIEQSNEEIIAEKKISNTSDIYLRMIVDEGEQYEFSWSTDGENWNNVDESIDGSYLPPWDRAVRIGLISKGSTNEEGIFKFFKVKY